MTLAQKASVLLKPTDGTSLKDSVNTEEDQEIIRLSYQKK